MPELNSKISDMQCAGGDIEIWRPVPGYEGLYSASSFGRIRSEDWPIVEKNGKVRRKPGRIRRLTKVRSGHLYVILSKNGVKTTHTAHSLIILSFKGIRPAGLDVCHNDGDPENNRPSNLRYGTRKSNEADKKTHGKTVRGERSNLSKLTEEQVLKIRSDQRAQHLVAVDYGVSRMTISDVKRRKSWAWLESAASPLPFDIARAEHELALQGMPS